MENDGFLDALAEAFRKAQSVSPPKEASGSYIRFKTDYEDACKQQNAQFSDQLASQQWENLENESKQEYARLAKRDQEYYSKLLSKYNHINNLRKKKPDGSVLFFSEKGLTKSHYNLQQQWDQISLEEKRIYELKAKQNQQDIIKSLIEEYILEYKNYENCLKEKPQNIKFINKQEDDNDEIDQIDIIIGIKRINGKKEYLVRFKGKTGKDAKWFPKKRLRKVKDLVKEFEDAYFRQSFQDEDPSSGFDSTPQQNNVLNQEKHEKIDDGEIDHQPQPDENPLPKNNSEEQLNQKGGEKISQKGVEKINQQGIKQKSQTQLKSQSKLKQQAGATKKIQKTRISKVPQLPEKITVSKKKSTERKRLVESKSKQKIEQQKENKMKQQKIKEKNIQILTDESKNQRVSVKKTQANSRQQIKNISKIANKNSKGKILRQSKSLESQKTQETEKISILSQKQDSFKNTKNTKKFKENKSSLTTIKLKNLQKNQKRIDKNTNVKKKSGQNRILSKKIQKEVSKKQKVKTESKDQHEKKKKVKQISISSKNQQQIKQISSQKSSKQDEQKNIKQNKTRSHKTIPKIIKKEIRKQITTKQKITHNNSQQEKLTIKKKKQNNVKHSAVIRKIKQNKSGSTRTN